MRLRVLIECDEKAWREIVEEIENSGEEMYPLALSWGLDNFLEYLKRTQEISKGENLHEMVQADTYFLVEQERILGAINIRWTLNAYLENFGGHIGYGVRPSERKKGYATKMLKLALEVCQQRGLSKVLVTCDENNEASKRTILKCGGKYEDSRVLEGEVVERYWIEL